QRAVSTAGGGTHAAAGGAEGAAAAAGGALAESVDGEEARAVGLAGLHGARRSVTAGLRRERRGILRVVGSVVANRLRLVGLVGGRVGGVRCAGLAGIGGLGRVVVSNARLVEGVAGVAGVAVGVVRRRRAFRLRRIGEVIVAEDLVEQVLVEARCVERVAAATVRQREQSGDADVVTGDEA